LAERVSRRDRCEAVFATGDTSRLPLALDQCALHSCEIRENRKIDQKIAKSGARRRFEGDGSTLTTGDPAERFAPLDSGFSTRIDAAWIVHATAHGIRTMNSIGFHCFHRDNANLQCRSALQRLERFQCNRFARGIRFPIFAGSLLGSAVPVFADETIIRQSARTLVPIVPGMVSTPDLEISALWLFVLAVTAAILVGTLLGLGGIRIRSRPGNSVSVGAHPSIVAGESAIVVAEPERTAA